MNSLGTEFLRPTWKLPAGAPPRLKLKPFLAALSALLFAYCVSYLIACENVRDARIEMGICGHYDARWRHYSSRPVALAFVPAAKFEGWLYGIKMQVWCPTGPVYQQRGRYGSPRFPNG